MSPTKAMKRTGVAPNRGERSDVLTKLAVPMTGPNFAWLEPEKSAEVNSPQPTSEAASLPDRVRAEEAGAV